ncbi:zinc finger protein [Oryctes borbonicus]|uniref:Zinc finger protein n=1 Tax=Oryctes borbonicus TaxID=1629725 RepID=A0A0T6AYQ4_9SCAR|nr:zinc finger protein [Oryctes borbonicus]
MNILEGAQCTWRNILKKGIPVNYVVKNFQSCGLGLHIKIHLGDNLWRCEICNKSYRQYPHVLAHTKKHTRENFSCEACNKKFKQIFYLNKHMETHVGGKPYTCSNCNRGFVTSLDLAVHLRRFKVCAQSSSFKTSSEKQIGEKFSCRLRVGNVIQLSANK